MILSSNGFLDGSGNSAFGAHADHTHDGEGGYEPKNPALLKATKFTIAVADWEEGSASVEMPDGATYVNYVVDNGSASVAQTAELVLSEVGEATLTFGVMETPEDPIDIWVMYL